MHHTHWPVIYHHPTFTDRDFKPPRGRVTCPSRTVNVGQLDSRTHTLLATPWPDQILLLIVHVGPRKDPVGEITLLMSLRSPS